MVIQVTASGVDMRPKCRIAEFLSFQFEEQTGFEALMDSKFMQRACVPSNKLLITMRFRVLKEKRNSEFRTNLDSGAARSFGNRNLNSSVNDSTFSFPLPAL